MRHILVTGANGQLGRKVVSDLITTNHNVTATSLRLRQLRKLQSLGGKEKLNLIACNLVDTKEVSRLADKIHSIHVIIHLASGPPLDPLDHTSCTNQVIMSLNLIGVFGNQLEHAIIGSCTSVYGVDQEILLSENHPTCPTSYHGSSQLAVEKFWNLYAKNNSKTVTRLRFSRFNSKNSHKYSEIKPYEENNTMNETSQQPQMKIDTITEYSQSIMNYLKTKRGGVYNIYPNS